VSLSGRGRGAGRGRSWIGSESWDHHVVEQTASVAVVSFLQGDESVQTPRGSPGVAHDPGAGVLAHSDDAVIQVGAAAREDTSTLELPFLGIDRNCDRLFRNACHERTILTSKHLKASDIVEGNCGRAVLAGAVLGCLRLAFLGDCAICLELGESVLHHSTLAAMVHFVAVDQLLL